MYVYVYVYVYSSPFKIHMCMYTCVYILIYTYTHVYLTCRIIVVGDLARPQMTLLQAWQIYKINPFSFPLIYLFSSESTKREKNLWLCNFLAG